MFQPTGWLDRVFAVGIMGKGLNGAAELVIGTVLLMTPLVQLQSVAAHLSSAELAEDPHDLVATHLLHTVHGLTAQTALFGAIYLLLHGVVKVVLVAALLRDRLWAYPWMIAVLGLFIGYQVYRMVLHPTAGLAVLTLFDLVIVTLTWREMRYQQRRPHPARLTQFAS